MPVIGFDIDYWRLKLRAITWLVLGRNGSANDVFSEMLRRWPHDAYALASRAHVRAQLGERGGAIVDARALVRLFPRRSAGDWFNLAFLLESADQLDQAERAFRQAITLDPKLDRAWYDLGLTLIRLQRFDEPIDALERNTELQPPLRLVSPRPGSCGSSPADEARGIIRHLHGFEPRVAAQLERETGLTA